MRAPTRYPFLCGCGRVHEAGATCPLAASAPRRRHDYGSAAWKRRRRELLERDPRCLHRGPGCTTWSEVADHYPTERRELVAQGAADPDDLRFLVGACGHCARVRAGQQSQRLARRRRRGR